MENINLSPAEQALIQQNKQQVATNPKNSNAPEQKKDGKKLLIAGAAAVATVAIAGIMIYKGKAPKKLADIQFNGGKAKKGEKLFTGAIEDTLKNGNKIKLEYKDGVIQKAIAETNGKTVVKEYVDGVISKKDGKTIDIKKIQDEVKLNQEKLKKLLKDDTLSSEELSKQTDKIKYKSKNQQKEIDKIVDLKAQKEALKLRIEAQERATKEAEGRIKIQNNIKNAQAKQSAYLEEKLSKKSAQESASYIEQALIEQEQEKINKPFTEALSNKSAKESAKAIASGGDTKRTIRKAVFDKEGNTDQIFVESKRTGEIIELHYLDKNGNVVESYLDNGPTSVKIVYEPDGKVVYGNGTTKFYEKNDKGKYVISRRRKAGKRIEKIVEQREDCSTTTIFNNYEGTKQVIVRDKKGNILSDKTSGPDKLNVELFETHKKQKIFADWYVNYLELCKKYGVEPRKIGAWDHFYELRMLSTDSKEYENYIRLRSYRAKYDLKAKLMEIFDSEFDKNYVALCQQIANDKALRSQFDDEQIIEMLDTIKYSRCSDLPKMRSMLNELSNPNSKYYIKTFIDNLEDELEDELESAKDYLLE